MTSAEPNPRAFYDERVPAQWNRTLADQEQAATGDPEAQRLLEGMQSVNATIDVVVQSGPGSHHYHLNIQSGRMSADAAPERVPFLVLVHDLDTLSTLERESGDSVLGFLGTLAGQPGDLKLTSTRLQNLYGLRGSARIELTGGAPMTLTARFGFYEDSDPEPACTLRIASDAFAALRSGDLTPQDAFLGGRVEIEGDMQLAMQLALAAASTE